MGLRRSLGGLFRGTPRPPHSVTVYSKPGCHLCEDALELLSRLKRVHPMHVTEVNILSDEMLVQRYGSRIPVIVIDGGPELSAPIDERRLRMVLRETRPGQDASA